MYLIFVVTAHHGLANNRHLMSSSHLSFLLDFQTPYIGLLVLILPWLCSVQTLMLGFSGARSPLYTFMTIQFHGFKHEDNSQIRNARVDLSLRFGLMNLVSLLGCRRHCKLKHVQNGTNPHPPKKKKQPKTTYSHFNHLSNYHFDYIPTSWQFGLNKYI